MVAAKYVLPLLVIVAGDFYGAGVGLSSIALSSSSNPSVLGQPLTLTSVVSPASATGSVTFYDGITILGTSKLSGGQAAITTRLLLTGPHLFKAYYAGDAVDGASTSASLSHSITSLQQCGIGPMVSYGAGNNPFSFAVGDFNGDGKVDLVTASNSSGAVNVLIGRGDGTFQAPVPYATLPGLSISPAIATGDFNGDGKTDLAIANLNSNQVAILLGNGDGTFQNAVAYAGGGTSTSIVVADFNGDGKADLATGNGGYAVVLLGNGDGTFQSPRSYSSGVSPQGQTFAAGDFNGDGIPDLAAFNSSSNSVSVMLGYGDGTFQLPQVAPLNNIAPAGSHSLAVGDLNRDGNQDIVVATGSATVIIMFGDGHGGFDSTGGYIFVASPQSVAIGDVNADGAPDLVTAGDGIGIVFGHGNMQFDPGGSRASGTSLGSIALADVNGDGCVDIVAGNAGSNSVGILLDTPAIPTATTLTSSPNPADYFQLLSFTLAVTPAAATGPVTIFDGATPLITFSTGPGPSGTSFRFDAGQHSLTAVYSGDTTYGASTSPVLLETVDQLPTTTALVSLANPSVAGQPVTLSATVSSPVAPGQLVFPPGATGQVTFREGPTTLGTVTLNGSSAILVVPALPLGANVLTALYSGDTNYAPSTSASLTQTVVPPVVKTATTTSLTSSPNPARYGQNIILMAAVSPASATGSVTFYDGVNVFGTYALASGHASLVTSQLVSGVHAIRAAYSGDASFVASTSVALPQTVVPVQQSGFGPPVNYGNSLGQDVKAADFNGDGKADLVTTNFFTTRVQLGNGDGTFQTSLDTGWSGRTAVGDFNGDGKPDLLINTASTVIVLLGNGNGTFHQAGAWFDIPNSPMVVGDFNRDGKADVAIQNVVLLGNGDGTFQTELTSGLPTTQALAIGDFNGDGIPDLVSAINGSAMRISLGNGDGTFQTPIDSGFTGDSIESVAVGDFNGDGKADVALAFHSGNVNVFLGHGDGTFRPPVNYVTGTYAISIGMGDFNSDGRTDLAVVNFFTNNYVSILLGNGDGTFQTASNYPLSTLLDSVAVGDYNGDGRADLAIGNSAGSVTILLGATASRPSEAGIFRQNFLFALDSLNARNGTSALVYTNFVPSVPGDIPVAGDWNGSGTSKIGIYRPTTGTWFLDYNGDGIYEPGVDKKYQFGGIPGDVAVVGDWNGSGFAKIGLVRPFIAGGTPALWILDITGNGVIDAQTQVFAFGGISGDIPVVGDWTGNGISKVGMVRPFAPNTPAALWILDANNNHMIDTGDLIFAFGGIRGDTPVVGDWNGTGFSKAGMVRPFAPGATPALWVVDNNGSAPFTLGSSQVIAFPLGGIPGDVPIVGKW